jgi:hypothetical protein
MKHEEIQERRIFRQNTLNTRSQVTHFLSKKNEEEYKNLHLTLLCRKQYASC